MADGRPGSRKRVSLPGWAEAEEQLNAGQARGRDQPGYSGCCTGRTGTWTGSATMSAPVSWMCLATSRWGLALAREWVSTNDIQHR
jgi:hypothetical protein